MKEFYRLVEIMEKLRGENGCPWDREQSIESLKPYLLEETYEVLEAMDMDREKLCDELGDLLLQIVFQSQIAKEEGTFNIEDVARAINEKLIRRHPHIFKSDVKVNSSEEVAINWERIKREEKAHEDRKSILDGIPKNMPPLMRAQKIQKKVAKVGFDWPNIDGVLDKVQEEIEELRVELKNKNRENIKNELGDLMFSLVNLSRSLEIDAQEALLKTINKFDKRFRYVESKCQLPGASLEEMDKLWEESKKR